VEVNSLHPCVATLKTSFRRVQAMSRPYPARENQGRSIQSQALDGGAALNRVAHGP